MNRLRELLRERRGNVLVFVLGSLTAAVAFTGVGMDIGRVIATKAQLQRNYDAAALAGTSRLDLSSTGLTNAVTAAQTWSLNNTYTGGTPTFATWTSGTNATGNIRLGIWDFAAKTF